MSKKRMKDLLNEAHIMNNITFKYYFHRLKEYALNLFEWTGLEDTNIDERFMEMKLIETGSIAVFEDPTFGILALPYTHENTLNMYENPTNFRPHAVNYQGRKYDMDEGVIIWNNRTRTSIIPELKMFASRLTNITRTSDVNIGAQKTPVLVRADESQRLTLINAYMQYEGFMPFIFGTKSGFDKDAIDVFQTEAPFIADKLQLIRNDIWNEAMTFLGIGNSKQDKKERMVKDEVNANDEQIQSSRYIMLQERQKACKEINKKFNFNLWVEYKLPDINEEV